MSSTTSELPGYTLLRKIGSGTFADVYYGVHVATKVEVAVKVTRKSFDEYFSIQNVKREAEILMSLHHPFIAEFYEFHETDTNCYMVMEYVNGLSLLEYVNEKKGLSDTEAKHIFQQIVSAVMYMHSKNIIHRDLKAENIMFNPKTKRVRIIDFGFSNGNSTMFQTMCGSLAYCAPEILKRQQYTLSADIWSLGVVLYSMIRCCLPFHGDNQPAVMNKILNEEPKYGTMSVITSDLAKQMLVKDPSQRITAQEVHDHPFLLDAEYTALDQRVNARVASYEQVDTHIVDYMKEKGWASADVEQHLRDGVENEEMVTYRILRRTGAGRPQSKRHFRHTVSIIQGSTTADPQVPLRMALPREPRGEQTSANTSRENVPGLENQMRLSKPTFNSTARNSGRLELKSLMSSMFREGSKTGWRGQMPQIRQRTLTFE